MSEPKDPSTVAAATAPVVPAPVVPAPVAPAPAPAVPAAAPATEASQELTLTTERLNARLAQAKRAQLRELGVDSVEAFQALKAAADETLAKAKEAERAEMDEITRLKADLEAATAAKTEHEQAASAAAEEAEALRTEAHLLRLFSEHGINNAEYGLFKVEQALSKLKDGEMLDEVEFITKLAGDASEKAALGMAPPKVTGGSHNDPPPVVDTGTAGGTKNAMDMTDEQWAAFKRDNGMD